MWIFSWGIRLEIPDLRLLVTIGNDVVARYLFKRRDNYTVIGSSTGAVAPKCYSLRGSNAANDPAFVSWTDLHGGVSDGKAYWESMLAQGWVLANKQYLMNVCTNGDTWVVPKNGLSVTTPSQVLATASSEGTQSSTNSSAAPLNEVMLINERGVIRLD